MSQPEKKESAGDSGNSDQINSDRSAQEQGTKPEADASLESTPEEETSEASSHPQYGDRNPNWQDRELPPKPSQAGDAANEKSTETPYGDRNPNWQDRDLPPQNR